ncbi:LytTR family DNA-binding domain-containing protein [Saccharopolyspora sp. S2-29]|uniref:LytTR family DNA-binding domain-containing protein n=1 Tax=Saccharopolyspora mangrovi TaxID=3082379 RepID=A0ABU6A4H3_9PSEU|nr:LytTR family DNA-binding domain-containing protein [Saccharopolyspora sp. S2-29]
MAGRDRCARSWCDHRNPRNTNGNTVEGTAAGITARTGPDERVASETMLREDALGSTRRVVGIKGDRQVLLDIAEVIVAEAVGRAVWLRTDLGRFRCATDGIDNIDDKYSECGFVRVHRSYLVNLSRVREVSRKDGGELELTVENYGGIVPVSRRRAKFVTEALGL